ncbi:hypothetical protein B0H14DRAFT_2596270 [Mycena olivaceomarginata]|nr:hypothetical protein B0H14DRAFT_2596270 [Mycena olivaceomarginata]
MPNPRGKNAYGDKQIPLDTELLTMLQHYAAQNLPLQVQIANLKRTKLKELNKKFNVPRIWKPPPLEVAWQAVIDKVQMDVSQNSGPNYFKTLLQQEGLMIPRDTIRKIMVEHLPLGFQN